MGTRIVPFIGYEDAGAAIDWLERAFGFVENRDERYEEAGVVTHAELNLDGATVFVSTPEGYVSPRRLRETSELAHRAYDNPWVIDGLYVEVEDVEAHHARAAAAGATIIRSLDDAYGMRRYTAEDPEGHRWMFGQQLGASE